MGVTNLINRMNPLQNLDFQNFVNGMRNHLQNHNAVAPEPVVLQPEAAQAVNQNENEGQDRN